MHKTILFTVHNWNVIYLIPSPRDTLNKLLAFLLKSFHLDKSCRTKMYLMRVR